MQPTFTVSLIRELRGSPLTVLIAILLLEEIGQIPVSAQALKTVTGYGDHTIADSLRALESPTRQFVTRVTGGWRLTTGFQLPLMFKNRDIRDYPPTTTTRLEETYLPSGKIVEAEVQNRDIRGFTSEQSAIYKMLGDALVGEPVRTRLSLDLDDPLYVLAHCYKASLENTDIPLLIHRLRYRDQVEGVYLRKAQDKLNSYLSE